MIKRNNEWYDRFYTINFNKLVVLVKWPKWSYVIANFFMVLISP
jgi:hypothetical protein